MPVVYEENPSLYGILLQIPDLSIEPSFHIQNLSIKSRPSTRPLFSISVTRPLHVSGSMLLCRSDLGSIFVRYAHCPATPGQARQENAGTVQSKQPFRNDINDQIVRRSTTSNYKTKRWSEYPFCSESGSETTYVPLSICDCIVCVYE